MSKLEQSYQQILDGKAMRFDALQSLLLALGFECARISGSHHIFKHRVHPGLVNIQPDGKHAKAYQVKQIRGIILHYGFRLEK